MKTIFILLFLLVSGVTHGQIIGKVYVDDSPIDVPAGTSDHFEFEVSGTSISSGEDYLKYFVDTYGSSFPKKSVMIIVQPGASVKKEESEKTAMKRIEMFEKIFKKTPIKIAKGNFKEQTLTCILKLK